MPRKRLKPQEVAEKWEQGRLVRSKRRMRRWTNNNRNPIHILEQAAWYRMRAATDPEKEFREAMKSGAHAWIATARTMPPLPLP